MTVVECCSEPDIPVTVIGNVPDGVPGEISLGPLAAPPPHPTCDTKKIARTATGNARANLLVFAAAITTVRSASTATQRAWGPTPLIGGANPKTGAVVVIVNVVVAEADPGVTPVCDNEQ